MTVKEFAEELRQRLLWLAPDMPIVIRTIDELEEEALNE